MAAVLVWGGRRACNQYLVDVARRETWTSARLSDVGSSGRARFLVRSPRLNGANSRWNSSLDLVAGEMVIDAHDSFDFDMTRGVANRA